MNRRHPGSELSRRGFLRGASTLGGAALLGLAGCSSPGAAAGRNVELWHLLTGPDGEILRSLLADFTAEHPQVSVNQTVLEWGTPYYTKLAMASTGGRAPDVAVMHASRLPGYAPGGLLDHWDMDLFAELGVGPEQFPERVWDKVVRDGQLVGVPLDIHPFVLFYNLDIAEQAGALGSDGLLTGVDTPEGFRDVALRMGEVTGATGLSYGFLDDPSNMWRMFYTWYKQMGADMALPEGGPMEIDEDVAVRSLEWIVSLLDDEVASSSHDGGTAISAFATGRSGMYLGGVWELVAYQDQGVPVGMEVVPNLFGEPVAYCDSHSFVLPHQSSPDPDVRRAAHQMMASLLKNSLQWAQAGHLPVYRPVLESPEYGELEPQSDYAEAADYAVYDPEAWFTGSGADFHNYFSDYLQQVYTGAVAPRDGLRAFVDRINRLLSRPSPI